MNLSFHPLAETDLAEAAAYYESRFFGLGEDFLAEVRSAIERVLEAPEAWPRIEGPVRKRLVDRFPFVIFYQVAPSGIFVLAIMHSRRRPGSWRGRL